MPSAPINNTINAQPNGPSQPQQAPAAALVPFIRASQEVIQQGATQTLAAASWQAGFNMPFNVPSYGFLGQQYLTLTGSGGSGTATVAAQPDAPWSAFASVLVRDANGTPIVQLDGYAGYLARLLGGYMPARPDQSTFGYSAIVTGANASGNFKFKYEIEHMFGPEGWGLLPNMDASAVYTTQLTFNGPSSFYSTAPTNLPSITALIEGVYRSRPNDQNAYGQPNQVDPPAKGTVSYWTSQTFPVVSGANTLQLNRVGNVIRNHILVFRDASGSRSSADSTGVTPTSITMKKDASVILQANTDTLRQRNYETYLFDVPAGVIALPYTTDPTGMAGHEYGDSYLSTATSTNLQFVFTSSAAGTLQVITNDIVINGSIYPANAF